MANKNLSGMSVLSGFALKSSQPLDARLVVNSLDDLDAGWIYTGLVVYVNSDDDKKGLYVYTGESWKPVATSATTGDIEIPEVDLTGYATEQYVKDEIAKIDFPSEVTEDTVSGWGFTKNSGTVTSVQVQAGIGLSSSVSTAQTGALNTTISIADGYKLPTTEEWNAKGSSSFSGNYNDLTNKPAHDYLPLSGGTVTGNITANSISANSISSEVLKGVIFKSDDTAAALKFSDNNEINFGSNGDTLFLGYDATRISADNGVVGNYRFGNSTGSAGMMAGKIYCGEVYVNNGTDKVITQADLESEVLTITNNNPTLSWSSTSTIGTIGGVSLTVTMPANPNTDTDTKVKQTSLSSGTTDYYLLASSTSSPTSGTAYEAKYNTSVKLNGNGQLTAASFYATSDARKKENIKEFVPKKSILDLPIVEFDFKDSGLHQIGCLAQDLQKICPEIVNTDQDGYLSINESKIVYLLLDEIKKLKKEIDEIKGK